MNRPFVGNSGKLLRSSLLKAGLPLTKCYITNSVKCFPHGTPTKEQISICSKNYLQKELKEYSPKCILAVGASALSTLIPGKSLAEARSKIWTSWLSDALVYPVWHPAYILRNRSKETEWINDLENFVALTKVEIGY